MVDSFNYCYSAFVMLILLLASAFSGYAYPESCMLHRLVIFTLALPHTDTVHVFPIRFAMPINRSLGFSWLVLTNVLLLVLDFDT